MAALSYLALNKIFSTKVIYSIGYFFVAVGNFLTGPSQLLNLHPNPMIIGIGVAISAHAGGQLAVPTLQ